MSALPLHRLFFATDDHAVRVLVRLSPTTAAALEHDLIQLAKAVNGSPATRAWMGDRVRAVKVEPHASSRMSAAPDPAFWGAEALMKRLFPEIGMADAAFDLVQAAKEVDQMAARWPITAPHETWSTSWVLTGGGTPDRVIEELLHMPVKLRPAAEAWLGELRDWLAENDYAYDGAMGRLATQPVAHTVTEALTWAQDILCKQAHANHPWCTDLVTKSALATVEARAHQAQATAPKQTRRPRLRS